MKAGVLWMLLEFILLAGLAVAIFVAFRPNWPAVIAGLGVCGSFAVQQALAWRRALAAEEPPEQ